MTDTNNENSSNFKVNQSHLNKSESVITFSKSSQVEDVNESIVMPQFNKGLDIKGINDNGGDQTEAKDIEKSFPGSKDDESIDNSARCIERKNDEIQSSLFATATSTSTKNTSLYMKDHLLYLAKLLGFEVDFSDYPKGNHNEFLTIVMLSTHPPQICHGVGVNAKESQDDAAKNALKILSEMGLNNAVKS